MSLQAVFNISNSLTINRRKLVGIQYSRSQMPKTNLSPTKNPWRFTMSVPGQSWSSMRGIIEALDTMDRFQPANIYLGDNTNLTWMFRYLGEAVITDLPNIHVDSFVGNQLTLTNLPVLGSSRVLFEQGDMIQIGTEYYPYTVTSRVLRGTGSSVVVTTHRPNVSSNTITGNSIHVGSDCTIKMFCPNMPTYKLIPGAQQVVNNVLINNAIVEWSDSFQLYEFIE